MKNIFRDNTFLFFVLFGFMLSMFYWFGIRTANIRKYCHYQVNNNGDWRVIEAQREKLGGDMLKIDPIEREKYTFWFNNCLDEHGVSH